MLSTEKPLIEKPLESSEVIEKFSKYEGYKIAEKLKNNIEWIDLSCVIQGIHDYISGKKLQDEVDLAKEEIDFYRITFKLFELESKDNLHKALSHLQELARDTKLHVLENGKIIYEVIARGHGPLFVQKESAPLLQYVISTLDGQEIANTRKGSNPCRVPLAETIPGFAKGVEGMQVGERRKIFIHPDFGYGKVGHVPPNSLLIADVEAIGP